MMFDEFRRVGRFGCVMCYSFFLEKFYFIFCRIYGNIKYVGKILIKMGEDIVIKREIDRFKIEFNVVIKNEEYEKVV